MPKTRFFSNFAMFEYNYSYFVHMANFEKLKSSYPQKSFISSPA